ncbi:MAG TPA: hypothetical protein DCM14_00805 [Clostridiales bacterium UBA8153]|nr:hypothetical protein [Clostridiales bacterium UBA8153]
MDKLPPSQRPARLAEELRKRDEVEGWTGAPVRLGARKLVQERREPEAVETLGPGRYAPRGPGRRSWRKSDQTHRPRTAKGQLGLE